MNTIEEFNKSVMHTYGRFDLVVEKGSDKCVQTKTVRNISISAAV